MNESLTVSAIAKRTTIDRRSVERALVDLKPVEISEIAGRKSARYDRDAAAYALRAARLPSSKVARLVPFGGSVSRLVAWNVCARLIRPLQSEMAATAPEWVREIGVTRAQADEIAARVAIVCGQFADQLLADFGGVMGEDTTGLDAILAPESEPRDAEPGEFMDMLDRISSPEVKALLKAGVTAMRTRKGIT